MTICNSSRIAVQLLMAAAIGVTAAAAQNLSPYLEKTGRGAYDLYRDTQLCNAALVWAFEAGPERERRPQIQTGINYTASFALFLLESGNVVDPGRAILTPDKLPADREAARAAWQAVLVSIEDNEEATETEIARCLGLYGHDWE